MLHKGKVIKLPANIDTDIIIPTQYMTLETIEEMSKFAFSPLRPEIPAIVKKGDILVCDTNFGCGSSREQATEIIKHLGVYCVIAKSFSRIFYRNSINNGLLVIENSAIYDKVNEGEFLTIDLDNYKLITEQKEDIIFSKIPDNLFKMIKSGGLVNYYVKMNKKV